LAAYVFSLDSFHIDQTRAWVNDTDVVTFAVRAGDQLFPPISRQMGDVNNGDHNVNLAIGPVEVNPGDEVVVSYIIVNSGFDSGNEPAVLKVLNTLSDMAATICSLIFGSDYSAWDKLNQQTQWQNRVMFANCDGVVAGDLITLTGDVIANEVNLHGTYSDGRPFQGTASNFGCNQSLSQYIVNWSVHPWPWTVIGQGVVENVPQASHVAAYFAPSDNFHHIIAETSRGGIEEVWFSAQGGPNAGYGEGKAQFAEILGVVALAAYYAPSDRLQHVIVASNDGSIQEIWYQGGGKPDQGSDLLATYPGVIAVAGYYAASDHYQHVMVALGDGTIHEEWFKGRGGRRGHDIRATFPGVVAIAGYFAPSDSYQHLIVATDDGSLHEVWHGHGANGGEAILANFPGMVGLAAYYSPSDQYQHIIVATNDGAVHEVWFPGGGRPMGHDVRARIDNIVGVAGYYASDDKYQHVIVADKAGNLTEVYRTP
jgi:hypothetical protein